jgi:hypothetical protein
MVEVTLYSAIKSVAMKMTIMMKNGVLQRTRATREKREKREKRVQTDPRTIPNGPK